MILGVSGARVYMTPKDFRCGWCDECQATVWALEMILVEKLPLYKAFRNRPKHLSRGNFINLFYLPIAVARPD